MDKDKGLLMLCDCGCTVLDVYPMVWDEYSSLVVLTIYGNYDHGWRARLRHIWNIIKYGYPDGTHEILLSPESARILADKLVQGIKQEDVDG